VRDKVKNMRRGKREWNWEGPQGPLVEDEASVEWAYLWRGPLNS